jgi:hypothetical protein
MYIDHANMNRLPVQQVKDLDLAEAVCKLELEGIVSKTAPYRGKPWRGQPPCLVANDRLSGQNSNEHAESH